MDTTVPVITLNGDAQVTHEAGHVYLDANASWSDAVDGSGVVISAGEVNASTPGTYELTYDYVDGAGNAAARVARLVTVVDTTEPVIVLNGDANITHEAGFAYLDMNASWSDEVDGSGIVYAVGEVNASTPGTLALTSPLPYTTPLPSTASLQLAFASMYAYPPSCVTLASPFRKITGAKVSTTFTVRVTVWATFPAASV